MKKIYNIMVAVWGDDYTNFFLNYVVPNYISILSRSKYRNLIRLIIGTHQKFEDIIAKNKNIDSLRQLIEVLIFSYQDIPILHYLDEMKHQASVIILNRICKTLMEKNESELIKHYAINMAPDIICSRNFFDVLIDKNNEGYDYIIFSAGIRIKKEKAVQVFNSQNFDLSSIELASLIQTHDLLHDITKSLIINKNKCLLHAVPLYWEVKDEGYIIKNIHPHIFLTPLDVLLDTSITIDGKLPNIYKNNKIYIFDSNEDIMNAEVSDKYCGPNAPGYLKDNMYQIKEFFRFNLDNYNLEYLKYILKHNIRIYTKEKTYIDSDLWNNEEKKFDDYINVILDRLEEEV